MIPTSFQYKKATDIDEALQNWSEDTKWLSGGHSLIPAMKLRLNQPDQLIDVSRITRLRTIEELDGRLYIGAAVTHGEIVDSPLVKSYQPIFVQGAEMIGDVQVRNKGTIGGSLAHADPAADWPAMVIAANAHIHLQSRSGKRTVEAADFFTGFYETVLHEDELITSISVPKSAGKSHYTKLKQPASRFAIVGIAVQVNIVNGNCESCRVGVTGLSSQAYLETAVADALIGQSFTSEAIEAASQHAGESAADIMSDHYASEAYRRQMAKVFTRRALMECL